MTTASAATTAKTAKAKTAARRSATTTPAAPAPIEPAGQRDVTVAFRGMQVPLSAATQRSARFVFASSMGMFAQVIYEVVGDARRVEFMSTVQPGETFDEVAAEFLTAMTAALATEAS